jgi:hypothetical protein
MELLTREQILKAEDTPYEVVEVPEWGGSVLVWTMSGAERDAFEEGSLVKRGRKSEVSLHNLRARLCTITIRDQAGKRLFTKEDIDSLGKKSAKALDRVFGVAQRLNGFTEEDIQELVGNSKVDQNASPGST